MAGCGVARDCLHYLLDCSAAAAASSSSRDYAVLVETNRWSETGTRARIAVVWAGL